MKPIFDHEKLMVYQESLVFCGWVGEFLERIAGKAAVKDQLDRASTSVPLNIAEGNGKFSNKDRARIFEIARGSALECAACQDVLVVRGLATEESIIEQKERLARVVNMLMGLLRRFSPHSNVLKEDAPEYGSGSENRERGEQEREREQSRSRSRSKIKKNP
ncbi:MAG TPA: four helix bundle protein [Chthoniobacteraceae bacterium]|jgi:four helix bundle protein|nr:four helix bundle protein [Chthoniobacteraceae bacterium]